MFVRNLVDELFPRDARAPVRGSEPGAFWPDVFVASGLPWSRLAGSFALHVLVIAGVWSASRAFLLRPYAVPPVVLSHADVIYFSPSEYLPPIDTGSQAAHVARKGDPEIARQAIISVPPEADNRTQTIVTPPDIQLKHDVPMPNIVAWNSVTPPVPLQATNYLLRTAPRDTSAVIAPPPTVEQAADRRRLDLPENSVIAPAPEVVAATSRRVLATTQSAIIEPPPVVSAQIHRVGAFNIGHDEVIAPAPALPLGEQRAIRAAQLANTNGGVVPPPPSIQGTKSPENRARSIPPANNVIPPAPTLAGSSAGNSRIIALGIHPVVGAPPVASGNRRGSFAATPRGKAGSSGTPEMAAQARSAGRGGNGGGSEGTRSGTAGDKLPPGLQVGAPPQTASEVASTSSKPLLADARPPNRVTTAPHHAVQDDSPPSQVERQVFGQRKSYAMLLNMPNLNSAGGSWVIHFAELKNEEGASDLTAPELTRKVDPAYPLELMRTQVEGTVTLYAVIHSDGTVGEVRILNTVDERLDSYAKSALSRWRFRPATKNGDAVAVEAVVMIPFRAHRTF